MVLELTELREGMHQPVPFPYHVKRNWKESKKQVLKWDRNRSIEQTRSVEKGKHTSLREKQDWKCQAIRAGIKTHHSPCLKADFFLL